VSQSTEKRKTLNINKDEHPVLSQQTDPSVIDAATKLYNEDHGPKGIAYRDAVATVALQIKQGNLVFVDAGGKALTGTAAENRRATVTKIFGEVVDSTPSSTLYNWISHLEIRNTYPTPIRDAAEKAKLNLALDHVKAKYDEMLQPGGLLDGKTPAQLNKLTALEADGVVLKLKAAKKPPSTTSTTKSKGVARFQELIDEAFDYAKNEKLDPAEELTSLFGRVFKLTDKLEVQAADIVFAMSKATGHLTKGGFVALALSRRHSGAI
jgi:hypothetical protein